jgi:hypothetical protein
MITRSLKFPHVRLTLISASFALLFLATGFGDSSYAWLDTNSFAKIVIRIAVIILLIGSGFAWLFAPNRDPHGSVTVGLRLLVIFAFSVVMLQTIVMFTGNPIL